MTVPSDQLHGSGSVSLPATAIQVRGLVKRYGATQALCGIDLEIEAGKGMVVGLLGPNGAGKTTLVEILEGLRSPTSGSVRVLGLDPTRDSAALCERLGLQLQATALPQDLTVGETVKLFASFYERALPCEAVLERVGLAARVSARVRTLSGGQQQRLALALALVNDPALLVLDEPTAGLDPAARRALHDSVRSVRDQGRLVLLTTHYIEEAEALCDRVILLNEGRIVADGSPLELMTRSGGASTLWVQVDGTLDPSPLLATGAIDLGLQGAHHAFRTEQPARAVVALGTLLQDQQLGLTDLRLRRPTLEDVYLELLGTGGGQS